MEGPSVAAENATPSFGEAIRTWAKVGLLSFGGPAAQIALMHRIIVEEKRWMAEPLYLSALSFCMLLPGPEAMQLATYAGWRLHGIKGGLAAGLFFVLPGAFVVLSLSAVYVAFGNLPLVVALFLGIKSAVLVIVIEALLRIGRRALKGPEHWAIAAIGFLGIFFLALPFPLIVFAAAIWGFFRANRTTQSSAMERPRLAGQTVRTAMLWLAIWLAPLVALGFAFGPDHILASLGPFFSRLAVVTFGGAYAVLAYMSQDWGLPPPCVEAGQMVGGCGAS